MPAASPTRQKLLTFLTYSLQRRKASPFVAAFERRPSGLGACRKLSERAGSPKPVTTADTREVTRPQADLWPCLIEIEGDTI